MVSVATASTIYGESIVHCVACGGGRIRYWRQKAFHYTENSNAKTFQIYRCADCGTGFLNRPPHSQWLAAIYRYSGQALTQPITLDEVLAREAEFPNCAVDAQRMATQADRCNRSGNRSALDIGSGFGFYTHALRQQGYRTVGINPGTYENQVFKAMNGDQPVPMLFEQYPNAAGPFGVVMMSQVLEHMLEPERALAKVASLLAEDGVLACAVPNYRSFLVKLLGVKDNACLWVPEHVNYFTEQGLTALLERNGLRVVKREQITRVPFNALSKRLGLRGRAAAVANGLIRLAQIPFTRLLNALGLGIYLNIYAIKQSKGDAC